MSSLKWVRVAIGAIVCFVFEFLLGLIVPTVIGFQNRGMPPQDQVIAAIKSPAAQIVGVLLALLGGYVGGRMAARPADTNRPLAGLATGVLAAILLVAWRAISWGTVDLWVVLQAVAAIAGGCLAGWLAGRSKGEEFDESPNM